MSYGNKTRYIGTFASEPLANAALNAALAVFAAKPAQGRSAEEVEATVKRAKEAAMKVAMQMSGQTISQGGAAKVKTQIRCKKVQEGGMLCCDLIRTKPIEYSKLRYVKGRKKGSAWMWRTDNVVDCKKCGRHTEWAPTDNAYTQGLENKAKGIAN